MARRSYALHRWLNLLVGLQLMAWSLGGLIFATHSIAWVRSEAGQSKQAARSIPAHEVTLSPQAAAQRAAVAEPTRIVLGMLLDRPVYEVHDAQGARLVDAGTGEVLSPIPETLAVEVARRDRAGQTDVREARSLSADPPTEYRDGELPAWRIELADDDNTHIYVSAATGRITARRNDAWRRFDFFWMLHTMDYSGRDDFNHPLLIGAASLAVLSVCSGWFLWGLRIQRRRARRRRRDTQT